ncbi:MAG: helix-turn-helix transcriptional regulator [Clostridia bacterium]|nr:helix-turn-helix transcriptional regulator [Clostridia bacterium]
MIKKVHYKRLRDLREDHDLTQVQVAKMLSCSQRVYSNYERGDIDIPTYVLIELSNFYGVSVDYLLGLTDNPKRNT